MRVPPKKKAPKKAPSKKTAPKAPTKASGKDKSITKMPTMSKLQCILELIRIKDQKKLIKEREDKLRADLGVYLEAEGVKDSKGSFNLIEEVEGAKKFVQKQARKSVKLNAEKAEILLKELGIWDEVTETKEVINEDYLEQAIVNEKLTQEDFESICDINTTYAVVINDYEPEKEENPDDMPEIKTTRR